MCSTGARRVVLSLSRMGGRRETDRPSISYRPGQML